MIKLLVVSDSHLDTILLNKVYLKHQNCDYFLHLGDSCLPSYALNNFSSVLGNEIVIIKTNNENVVIINFLLAQFFNTPIT